MADEAPRYGKVDVGRLYLIDASKKFLGMAVKVSGRGVQPEVPCEYEEFRPFP